MTVRNRFFMGVDYDGTVDTIAQDEMSANQSYWDLNAVFRFMVNHDVVLGVNNIFDEEPPISGSVGGNGNTIAGFFDTLGRYLYAKATFRF